MTLAEFFRSEQIDRRISELRTGALNPQVQHTNLCRRMHGAVVNSSTKGNFQNIELRKNTLNRIAKSCEAAISRSARMSAG